MKILVAEDEKICQTAIANLGKRLNVEVVVANDGKEAVEKASEMDFDLILMDMYMPLMNGTDATLMIRNSSSSNSNTIIILLSGGK